MMFFLSRTFNSKNTTTSCLHGAVVVAWVHHKVRQGDLVGNTMKIRISESLKLSCIYVFEQRQWSGYMKRKSRNTWKASAMLLWKRRRTRNKIIPLAAFFVRLGAWEYQKRFGVQLCNKRCGGKHNDNDIIENLSSCKIQKWHFLPQIIIVSWYYNTSSNWSVYPDINWHLTSQLKVWNSTLARNWEHRASANFHYLINPLLLSWAPTVKSDKKIVCQHMSFGLNTFGHLGLRQITLRSLPHIHKRDTQIHSREQIQVNWSLYYHIMMIFIWL